MHFNLPCMKNYLLLPIFFFLYQVSYAQQTYYVAIGGKDEAGRDGKSPTTAWKSLGYASGQVPEGDHTIQLGEGIFALSKPVKLKNGWTITGQGHTGSKTTTLVNSASFSPTADPCQLEKNASLENYLLGGANLQEVTISNLILSSREDQPLDGALLFQWAKRVDLSNLLVDNFRWNGIYIYNSQDFNIHHCKFEDASYKQLCYWGGAVRTRYVKDFTLHHCEFKTTKGGGYGYKASGHENAKIHDNIFHNNTSLGPNDGRPFDLESAHEFEWGLEIYHNTFNGMVSVPRAGGQAHPSDRGDYTYTVRIHDNVFYGSGGVEGPRSYLEIDHNYFVNKWGNNGRVYEIHGGENAGPTKIHHNVAECSMGFLFKKGEMNENMSVYNNTVYLVNSTRHNFPTSFLEVSGGVKNWQVKNNLVFTMDEPNSGITFSRGSLPSSGLTMSHNLAWNISGTPASVQQANPGLALSGKKPNAYYLPKSQSSVVVDAGTDVGFPYQGKAPDLGAYEWKASTNNSPNEITNGVYALKNKKSGEYLWFKNGEIRTTAISAEQLEDWSSQRFIINTTANGARTLRHKTTQQYLWYKNNTVSMNEVRDANLDSWSSHKWYVEHVGEGYVRLKHKRTQEYLTEKSSDIIVGQTSAEGDASLWNLVLLENTTAAKEMVSQKSSDQTIVENEELVFYPNPADHSLVLNLARSEQIVLSNTSGVEMNHWVLNKGTYTLDISRVPSGIYLLKAGASVSRVVVF